MENKKRLIDANALIEDFEQAKANKGMGAVVASTLIRYVKRCTTVDAVEVVHGLWIIERSPIEAEFKCSECGYSYIDADSYAKAEYNYCPNCGAKMDGERKGNERT